MAKEMRRLADELENGAEFVVLGLVSCNLDGEGDRVALVNRDYATVDLVDEMSRGLRDALLNTLE